VECRSGSKNEKQNCKIVLILTYFKTILTKRGELKVNITFNSPLFVKYDIAICRRRPCVCPTLG
jgi:hypothetical protein